MSSVHVERCKCAGKTPLIKGWQTHSETSVEDLIEWQKSFKSFNIGLPLGEASGYCGIDVDGEAGVALLMAMSKGDLPSTWEFTTGDGSRLLYLIPAGMKTKKFKQSGDNKHEECALLCSGQQTVIPPSIHKSGRQYLWIDNHSPWDMDCAMSPQWLLELIKIDEPVWKDDTTFNMEMQSNDVLSGLDDEFTSSEMSFDLPPDVPNVAKNVRAQTGKTGHKIVVTDELLTQRIGEGARDNTMTAIVGHYCANRDLRRFGKEFIYSLCVKHNRDFCDPPLEDRSIRDKVEYFFTAEGMKDETFKGIGRKDKTAFEPSNMATKVLSQLKSQGIYLHFDQFSKIYYYTTVDSGPWRGTRNYALIQKWIREVIISEDCGDSTWDKRSYIEEVRTALEESFTAPYKRVDDFDLGAHSDTLCDFVVVNNGMVDWRNKTLMPWNPEYKTTVSFDVDYAPMATCPRFEKYMSEWLPSISVRAVMQEYLGYCLIPNTNFRKALFLYGKGKNGKSMLIEFLQKFFGDYAANLSYDGLFSRFGPATLKDKLVNIFDDTTVSFTKETSIAKNLIAGGSISAEFKGRDMFSFNNVTRLIFSSQETPRTSDNTIAWYDRWYFIKFPNSFRPSNKAKFEIEQALAEEHAGIFNWMIDGLIRLMRNDEFTASDTLSLYNMEYRSQNDNVTQFVNSLCVEKTDGNISITDLYKVYHVWIATEQLRPVSKKVFVTRIEDMGFDRSKGYIAGKSGQSFFVGLQLNKEAEDFIENALEINIALSH
jgi:putative DNA primase/helicase